MRLKTINEAINDPKNAEGYKELLPYFDAVSKVTKTTPIKLNEQEKGHPILSFTFVSHDKQDVEIFFDPDSKSVGIVLDDDWMEADDISIDGALKLTKK